MCILKKNTPFLLAFLAMLAPLVAAPVNYTEPTTALFQAKRGKWSNPKNWVGGKIPEGFVLVRCPTPDSQILVDAPAPQFWMVIIGWAPNAKVKLTIDKNAILQMDHAFVVNGNNVLAEAELKGGVLELAMKEKLGQLNLGRSTSYSAQGLMTISSGSLIGTMTIGGPADFKGEGRLVIKGSEASIEDQSKTFTPGLPCLLDATGTIEFVLDAKGVSPLNYPKRTFKFAPGSQLKVDASLYKGAIPKQIPLINAANFSGLENLQKTVIKQPPQGEANIEAKTSSRGATLFLRITSAH